MRRFIIAIAVSVAAVACSPGAPHNVVDVQAAKACQVFNLYLQKKLPGGAVVSAIQPILTGKWSTLARDLATATGAAFTNDQPKLKAYGDRAVRECSSIPAGARKAGGYTG